MMHYDPLTGMSKFYFGLIIKRLFWEVYIQNLSYANHDRMMT